MAIDREDLVTAFHEFAQIVLPQLIKQHEVIKPATLTVDEAATYLGVCSETVRKLIREKELPHVRIAGRIFLRASTLDEYMTQQERSSIQIGGGK